MKKILIFLIAGVLSWETVRLLQELKVRFLTDREREILNLSAEGYTDDEIAIYLHIRQETLEKYLRNILKRFNVQDISSAIKHAIEMGLVGIAYA